jgi:hypothetical protein
MIVYVLYLYHFSVYFLTRKVVLFPKATKCSGHFKFKTLRSPTVVRLVSIGSPSSPETLGKIVLTSGYAGGPTIFLLPRNKSRNQHFSSCRNACVSDRQIPPVASQERVQALNIGDTTLSASPVDYDFHPYVQIEQRRMQEGARNTTAPNPICNLQGGIHHEGL